MCAIRLKAIPRPIVATTFVILGFVVAGNSPIRAAEQVVADNALEQPASNNDSASDNEPSQSAIAELIEGLASESYATRIRCRDQLSRIGLAAFDQLREARNHPDSEVAIVARRLTSGLGVQWSTDDDSSAVIELLNEYGARGVAQRKQRIDQLADLPRSESFAALLRLAKFEPEPGLARVAALELMNQDAHEFQSVLILKEDLNREEQLQRRRQLEAAAIASQLAGRRTATNRWLLQYANDLRSGEVQVARWQTILQQHRRGSVDDQVAGDTLGQPQLTAPVAFDDPATFNDPAESASQLLLLIRITAERAIAGGANKAALEMVTENVDLIPSRTRELIQAASWALDHSLYPAVVAMQDRHREMYKRSPILLYSAAEACSRTENEDDATRFAEIALGINPLPVMDDSDSEGDAPDSEPTKKGQFVHPQTIQVHAEAHVKIAMQLVQRGLFRWAEKEFDLVMQRLPLDNAISAYARSESARMFGEMQDHAAVIRILSPLAQRIEKDDEFKDRLIASNFTSPVVKSDLAFHQGLLLVEQGKKAEARKKLQEAFDTNQENIDILIAMYRVEGDGPWKTQVETTLEQQVRSAEREIEEVRNSLHRVGRFRPSSGELAKRLNAYAWLVSNTTGDYDKALRYSIESLRLTPNRPALMDTCARCYFAARDFESAVKMQADACERMPHSPPLQRQLEEFRAALKSSRESA